MISWVFFCCCWVCYSIRIVCKGQEINCLPFKRLPVVYSQSCLSTLLVVDMFPPNLNTVNCCGSTCQWSMMPMVFRAHIWSEIHVSMLAQKLKAKGDMVKNSLKIYFLPDVPSITEAVQAANLWLPLSFNLSPELSRALSLSLSVCREFLFSGALRDFLTWHLSAIPDHCLSIGDRMIVFRIRIPI